MPLKLNAQNLKSNQKEILLFNLTSGLEYLNFDQISFNEFYEDGMKISVPSSICSLGHSLFIVIYEYGEASKVKKLDPKNHTGGEFIAIGKVETFEKEKERAFLVIKFNQYSQKEWTALVQKFKEAQEETNSLLQKMKAS